MEGEQMQLIDKLYTVVSALQERTSQLEQDNTDLLQHLTALEPIPERVALFAANRFESEPSTAHGVLAAPASLSFDGGGSVGPIAFDGNQVVNGFGPLPRTSSEPSRRQRPPSAAGALPRALAGPVQLADPREAPTQAHCHSSCQALHAPREAPAQARRHSPRQACHAPQYPASLMNSPVQHEAPRQDSQDSLLQASHQMQEQNQQQQQQQHLSHRAAHPALGAPGLFGAPLVSINFGGQGGGALPDKSFDVKGPGKLSHQGHGCSGHHHQAIIHEEPHSQGEFLKERGDVPRNSQVAAVHTRPNIGQHRGDTSVEACQVVLPLQATQQQSPQTFSHDAVSPALLQALGRSVLQGEISHDVGGRLTRDQLLLALGNATLDASSLDNSRSSVSQTALESLLRSELIPHTQQDARRVKARASREQETTDLLQSLTRSVTEAVSAELSQVIREGVPRLPEASVVNRSEVSATRIPQGTSSFTDAQVPGVSSLVAPPTAASSPVDGGKVALTDVSQLTNLLGSEVRGLMSEMRHVGQTLASEMRTATETIDGAHRSFQRTASMPSLSSLPPSLDGMNWYAPPPVFPNIAPLNTNLCVFPQIAPAAAFMCGDQSNAAGALEQNSMSSQFFSAPPRFDSAPLPDGNPLPSFATPIPTSSFQPLLEHTTCDFSSISVPPVVPSVPTPAAPPSSRVMCDHPPPHEIRSDLRNRTGSLVVNPNRDYDNSPLLPMEPGLSTQAGRLPPPPGRERRIRSSTPSIPLDKRVARRAVQPSQSRALPRPTIEGQIKNLDSKLRNLDVRFRDLGS